MYKKGQGAMEYLMTYGWAILVVIIVGVVLWQMGVFTPGASTAANSSGFSPLKPAEWSCSGGTLSIVLINGAGGRITNVSVGGTDCTPSSVPAGNSTRCVIVNAPGCANVAAGSRFESAVSIDYVSPTGLPRASSGRVWGAAE